MGVDGEGGDGLGLVSLTDSGGIIWCVQDEFRQGGSLKFIIKLAISMGIVAVGTSILGVVLLLIDPQTGSESYPGLFGNKAVRSLLLVCTLLGSIGALVARFGYLWYFHGTYKLGLTEYADHVLKAGFLGGGIAYGAMAILLTFATGAVTYVQNTPTITTETTREVFLPALIPLLIPLFAASYTIIDIVLTPPKPGRAKADNGDDTPGNVRTQRAGVVSMLKWEFISIGVLLALILLGAALLVCLAPAEQMTPSQAALMELADTLVKMALGGIFVLIGLCLCRRRGGGSGGQ